MAVDTILNQKIAKCVLNLNIRFNATMDLVQTALSYAGRYSCRITFYTSKMERK